jgi:hypothetical protein
MTPRPLFIQHAEAADQQRRAPVQDVPAGYRFEVIIPGLRLVTLSNGPAFARFQKAKVSREHHERRVKAMLNARAVRCPLSRRSPSRSRAALRAHGQRQRDHQREVRARRRALYLGINDRREDLVDYVVKQQKTGFEMRFDPKVGKQVRTGIYWCRIEIARRA